MDFPTSVSNGQSLPTSNQNGDSSFNPAPLISVSILVGIAVIVSIIVIVVLQVKKRKQFKKYLGTFETHQHGNTEMPEVVPAQVLPINPDLEVHLPQEVNLKEQAVAGEE